VEATVEGFLESENGSHLDYRIVRPDGSIRYVQAVTFPLLDEAGRRYEYVGTVMDVTEQKQAAARLARVKRDARERTLQARFAAVLEERQRVARDIHDTILQGVTGIALQLRATLPNLGTAPPATVATIGRIVELADATVRDARRAIWQMRDPLLTRDGLPAALADEVRRRADGVEVHFAIDGVPRRLALDVEDAILRVGREAAVNAVRHSRARSVSVRLLYEPRHVRLIVEDGGRGFRTDAGGRSHGGHWGLLGMRESAERIGAALSVRSADGAGTTVELLVPTARRRKNRPAIRPARTGATHNAASSTEQDSSAHADSRIGR
jgi:signal transduction histidine kinase